MLRAVRSEAVVHRELSYTFFDYQHLGKINDERKSVKYFMGMDGAVKKCCRPYNITVKTTQITPEFMKKAFHFLLLPGISPGLLFPTSDFRLYLFLNAFLKTLPW